MADNGNGNGNGAEATPCGPGLLVGPDGNCVPEEFVSAAASWLDASTWTSIFSTFSNGLEGGTPNGGTLAADPSTTSPTVITVNIPEGNGASSEPAPAWIGPAAIGGVLLVALLALR
jgi:hypothetical protein